MLYYLAAVEEPHINMRCKDCSEVRGYVPQDVSYGSEPDVGGWGQKSPLSMIPTHSNKSVLCQSMILSLSNSMH